MPTGRVSKFAVLALALCGSAASAESVGTYNISLTVPLVCSVSHRPGGGAGPNGVQLGALREYCNSPRGYVLSVNYAPGTMKGAVLSVGDERVVLDGSGHAVISRSMGPRVRDRELMAEPGAGGFDTDRLDFDIQAA